MFAKIDDIYIKDDKLHIIGKVNTMLYDPNKIRINIDGKEEKPTFYDTKTDYNFKA